MTDEERQAIRQGTDLREIVAEDREVIRRGTVAWSLCPFHDDHHPSLAVERDHYHCYACGAHGDALDYVMAIHGLSFPEAAENLASRAGIELARGASGNARADHGVRADHCRRTRHAIRVVAHRARERLMQATGDDVTRACDWLTHTGIGDETRERWSIGFLADDAIRSLGAQAGVLPGVASLAGCVTFPISDALGQPTGIAGVTPGAPSHGSLAGLASFTVPITVGEAHLGGTPFVREALAGVTQARESIRKTGEAVVTLTPPQAASLQDMGATHAVSTMGGGLSVRQATRLARLGAARVTLLFPRTAAGRLAARASLPAATQTGADVMWVAPPEGGIRALRRQGMAALSAAVASAPWLIDAIVSEFVEGARLEDPDDLLDAVRATCATLRCAVGDVWQACACATSVARAFRVCRPETLYGALLDGSPLGDSSWEERRDGYNGR